MPDNLFMGDTFFNLVSVLYGVAGIYTLVITFRRRRSLFNHFVTGEDIRLAWMVAIFILVPLGVLVHEWAHFLAAQYFGATEIELHHRGYWGFVRYSANEIHGIERVVIAAAGPLAGTVLGYLCLYVAVAGRARNMSRYIGGYFGLFEVFHHTIGYPLMDLLGQMHGDFHSIYTLLPEIGIVLAALVHGALVALLILSYRRPAVRELINA